MGNCYSYYKNYKLNNELKNLKDDIKLFDLKGKTFDAKVVDVYDGDTCSIVIRLNNEWTKFKVRTLGYDTPEIKPPKNASNREELIKMAIKSRNYFVSKVTNCKLELDTHYNKKELKDIINKNTKIIQVKSHGWDKYGRLLGEIFVDNININNDMIEKKYGYQYDGGTKKMFDVSLE
jgi:endonuclease YncB( thermonuclease family)